MLVPSNFFRFVQATICFALVVVVCVGCGKPKPVPTDTAPAQAPANDTGRYQFNSAEEAEQALTGLWIGRAALNEETLKGLLSELPESQQQLLMKDAQTFASTQMAIQMESGGVMQTAIEVTPLGAEPIKGLTNASWSVLEVKENQVLIQATHPDKNNQPKVSRMLYTMSPDGNRIVTQANVGGPLKQCEPLVFLDRQVNERVAETPSEIR